jgi:site-specific DNA recombinase
MSHETLFKQFAKGKVVGQSNPSGQNCVIYTRVSSKEQMDTNQSLEWQKKHCHDYAIKNGLIIQGYFGGTYESAKSDERKEFARMLKFVKGSKEKISFILVYSLDRFSRTGDSAIYIAGELKRTGVNIIAVSQPIDTNSHSGVLQQSIQFVFSKFDNDLRRQKTVDGMKEKLLRGDWIGHAPTGYSFVKSAPVQTIIINEKGELIRQAFVWRSNGMTYEAIVENLKELGLKLPKQTLTDIFRNPFYCGLMSHNLLDGQLVKGNHPPLVDEDLFLRANELKKTDGYKVNTANDNLPLKVFVRDAESGAPFTGYLVRKKGLHYYKVNKIGIRINRSVNILHERFIRLLNRYTIDPKHIEPLQKQLQYTWVNLNETCSNHKTSLSLRLKELETDLYTMEKNHALGKVREDIFDKYWAELSGHRNDLLEEYEILNKQLSNPEELIYSTCKLASNLAPVWASGDYCEKQMLQYALFPSGLAYDSKIDDYRTPVVNSVIGCIADLSQGLGEMKSRTSLVLEEKSGSVPGVGVEPTYP